jgi:hypothetical protein
MAVLDFDSSTVEPAKSFGVLPRGRYNVIVATSELKETKAGDGQFLEVEYHVIDGEHESRRLWDRFNLVNPNADAERIGRSQLAALCGAVGVVKVGDSAELHDKPLTIEVSVTKRKDTGEDQNRIVGWMAADGAQTAAKPAAAPKSAAAPAAAPAAAKAPPWAKKQAA